MGAAKCANCGQAESRHCDECYACPGDHSGTCSKEPGNVAHRKRNGGR